jgi:hypothetical protein
MISCSWAGCTTVYDARTCAIIGKVRKYTVSARTWGYDLKWAFTWSHSKPRSEGIDNDKVLVEHVVQVADAADGTTTCIVLTRSHLPPAVLYRIPRAVLAAVLCVPARDSSSLTIDITPFVNARAASFGCPTVTVADLVAVLRARGIVLGDVLPHRAQLHCTTGSLDEHVFQAEDAILLT